MANNTEICDSGISRFLVLKVCVNQKYNDKISVCMCVGRVAVAVGFNKCHKETNIQPNETHI